MPARSGCPRPGRSSPSPHSVACALCTVISMFDIMTLFLYCSILYYVVEAPLNGYGPLYILGHYQMHACITIIIILMLPTITLM